MVAWHTASVQRCDPVPAGKKTMNGYGTAKTMTGYPPSAVNATRLPSGDWRGACTTRTRTAHTYTDTLYRQRRTASRHPIRRATMLHEHVRARSSPSLHDCRFCSTGRRDILQGPLRRAPPKPSHGDLCAHRRRRRACSSTVGAVLADPALSGCAAALVRSMARLRAERASRMRSPTPIKIPAAPTSCSPGPDTPHTMRAWHTRQS